MYLKIHKSYRHVVAVCDKELIGKKFEEGKRQLDVRESFFKGEEFGPQEVIKRMQLEVLEDATFNIVGQRAVAAAIEVGIINKEHVTHIQGIPFALTLL